MATLNKIISSIIILLCLIPIFSSEPDLSFANKEIIDSIQTISAISQQVSAHAGETMQAEEENLNVMQDVSAIMQKLAILAAHS